MKKRDGGGRTASMALILALSGLGATGPAPEVSPEAPMRERAITEIRRLHAFFEGWFNATLENTDDSYAQFSGVLAEEFEIVTPDGRRVSRDDLLAGLRAAHGSRREQVPRFRIECRDIRARAAGGDLYVVTYEEWQTTEEGERGRLSTALLRHRPGTPNSLEWLHVQETWLPNR